MQVREGREGHELDIAGEVTPLDRRPARKTSHQLIAPRNE